MHSSYWLELRGRRLDGPRRKRDSRVPPVLGHRPPLHGERRGEELAREPGLASRGHRLVRRDGPQVAPHVKARPRAPGAFVVSGAHLFAPSYRQGLFVDSASQGLVCRMAEGRGFVPLQRPMRQLFPHIRFRICKRSVGGTVFVRDLNVQCSAVTHVAKGVS